MTRLRQLPGDGLPPVGGSELASALLDQALMDELRIILTPVLLGAGNTVLGGIMRRHPLRLLGAKTFKSGNIVLRYVPAAR